MLRWAEERPAGAAVTTPDHRRKGLARALLHYGMEQLRRAGARSAWGGSVFHNPAATALYESAGMPVTGRTLHYRRERAG